MIMRILWIAAALAAPAMADGVFVGSLHVTGTKTSPAYDYTPSGTTVAQHYPDRSWNYDYTILFDTTGVTTYTLAIAGACRPEPTRRPKRPH